MGDIKEIEKEYTVEVRCPVHGSLIGKYDERFGIINVPFFCKKCKFEYVFTYAPSKDFLNIMQKPLDSCD